MMPSYVNFANTEKAVLALVIRHSLILQRIKTNVILKGNLFLINIKVLHDKLS